MFKLVIADDEGKTTVVPLVRDEITVGRKEGNTIRLTERNVSRRHARLVKSNGKFIVSDLHSYNGVKVNGQRIAADQSLDPGDQITIGDYQLALQLDASDSPTMPEAATPAMADADTAMLAAPPPPARVVMITPPAPGAEFALNRDRLRIGRAEDLDVWVNHRSISREHAEIQKAADGWRLIDLGSANGVRVNNKDVQNALLEPGDVIELGQVRFRFVGAGEHYAFEADRTVAMDAVAVEAPSGSKIPILVAVAIVGLAVVGAVAVALVGGGNDEEITVTEGGSPGPTPNPTAELPAAQRFAAALAACQTALQQNQSAVALAQANAALAITPGDPQATDCMSRASAMRGEEDSFNRGVGALNRGDLNAAYFAFEELPQTSAFRARPEVRDAMQRYARAQLDAAQAMLSSDAAEARSIAQLVLNVPGITESQRAEANAVLRAASRGGAGERPPAGGGQTKVAANPRVPRPQPPSPPPGQGGGNEEPQPAGGASAAANAETQARDCTLRGDNRCVIRLLEGHTSTAQGLAMLIEAYRAVGDQNNAIRNMRTYVSRYRNTPRAQAYNQILTRHQ